MTKGLQTAFCGIELENPCLLSSAPMHLTHQVLALV